jgi:hypothetical protein
MIRNILKEERNYKKIREKNKLTNQLVTSTLNRHVAHINIVLIEELSLIWLPQENRKKYGPHNSTWIEK